MFEKTKCRGKVIQEKNEDPAALQREEAKKYRRKITFPQVTALKEKGKIFKQPAGPAGERVTHMFIL